MDDAVLDVDVCAAKLGQLAEPQAAPGGEQDHQPVLARHRGYEPSSSSRVAGLILWTRLLFPAPRMWQGFTGMSWSWSAERQDGPQEAVGVRSRVGRLVPSSACQRRTSVGRDGLQR